MSDSKLLADGPVLELVVRGHKIPVTLSYLGTFEAKHGDRTYHRESLDALRADLMRATKAAKVRMEIPFTKRGNDFRDMVCTGRHMGTGNLVVVEKERGNIVEQWGYTNDAMVPLSADEKNTYRGLLNDYKAAGNAVTAFEKSRLFDLRKEVDRIMEAALAEKDA